MLILVASCDRMLLIPMSETERLRLPTSPSTHQHPRRRDARGARSSQDDLCQVAAFFKMSRIDLRAGPVFSRSCEAIKAPPKSSVGLFARPLTLLRPDLHPPPSPIPAYGRRPHLRDEEPLCPEILIAAIANK